MRASDVLNFVDSSSSIVKEVFASITTSKSKATQGAAKTQVLNVIKKVNDRISVNPIDYIQSTPVDVAVAIIDEWGFKQKETLKYKMFVAPVKGIWIRLIGFIYDLNANRLIEMSTNSEQGYFDTGNGLLLAGLYLICLEHNL